MGNRGRPRHGGAPDGRTPDSEPHQYEEAPPGEESGDGAGAGAERGGTYRGGQGAAEQRHGPGRSSDDGAGDAGDGARPVPPPAGPPGRPQSRLPDLGETSRPPGYGAGAERPRAGDPERGDPPGTAEDSPPDLGGSDEHPHLAGRGRAERRRAARRIRRRRRVSILREVPILAAITLLIALVLKTFLVQAFVIPSGSMEDTLHIGDRVVVDKLTPWFGAHPHRGDVVVFKDPDHWLAGEPAPAPPPEGVRQVKDFLSFVGLLPSSDDQDLIKRVIAVGGDEVKCCDVQGRITVNGHPLDEPYVAPGNPPSKISFDIVVPPGRLWVMGDHRSDSSDSRYHMNDPGGGTIPENLVVGKAFAIAWPVSHWRRLQDPATFASVPSPATAAAAPQRSAKIRQDLSQLPVPPELPLVTGVVGLYRVRRRLLSRSKEWKWGTLWSAHGRDPASRRGAAPRSAPSRLPRGRAR